MDPEQIYTEVLQAEQQKGSAAPVAEGRAKAARQRAIQGSPHPTEPKWWPGSQPHLEGGDSGNGAAAPEPEPEPEPEAVAAEPERVEPAPAPAEAQAPPADAVPADQGTAPAATSTPAPAPTAAPQEAPAAVAAAAEAPPQARPAGVTHGTPTGNRLRPEDGVSTEAQFEGQRAMYDRRKLIDELVATGVPEVSADAAGGRQGSPILALLYLIIPILAVAFLIAQHNETSSEAPAATESSAPATSADATITVASFTFDTDTLTLPAGKAATIDYVNNDAVAHNLAFYADAADGPTKTNPLWTGDEVAAGSSKSYETTALDKGEYYFQCDIHPNMNGTLKVE
ncbi:MAG: hypothetical protein QOH90_114 [Actinomycetota bacterium]|nr:hypothetical protein [Actinomycetota bacterium]